MRFLEGKSGRIFNVDAIVGIEDGGQTTIADDEGYRYTIRMSSIHFINGKNTSIAVPQSIIIEAINRLDHSAWKDNILSIEELQKMAVDALKAERKAREAAEAQEQEPESAPTFDEKKEFHPELNPQQETNIAIQTQAAQEQMDKAVATGGVLLHDSVLVPALEQAHAHPHFSSAQEPTSRRTWSPTPKPTEPQQNESNPD